MRLNLTVVSEKVAKEIEDMNEKELALIRTLAKLPFLTDGSMDLYEIFQNFKNLPQVDPDKYENIAFYNADGNSYVGDGRLINFKGRDYFENAMNGNEFISDPIFSTVNNQVLQFFSVPVRDSDNNIAGVVCAVLKGDRLMDAVTNIDVGAGFHPAVMNRKTGQTIANANAGTDKAGDNISDLDSNSELGRAISAVMSGKTGTLIFKDPNINMKMCGSYRPVAGVDWSVFCVAPYDYFYGELKHLKTLLIFGISVSVIVAFIIGYILISIIIKHLSAIKKTINEIASGNADLTKRLPAASNDEIGDVVKGFNQFVEKLQSIVHDIKRSNTNLDGAGTDLNASMEDTGNSINEILQNIEAIHGQINSQASSVTETAGAVNEIASNIESLERMIETQSHGVSQASTAVEEMIGNITSVNSSMDKMANSFEKLAESAQTGANLQANAAERIERIKVQSETLQEANLAIAAIAEQTIGSQQITDALHTMNDSTIEVKTASREMSEGNRQILSEVRNLQDATVGMKTTMEKMSDSARKISEAGATLETISEIGQEINQFRV